MTQKRRGAPPRKPLRITWRVERSRSLHPFANVVERGPEVPKQTQPVDIRNTFQRWQGDPLPGRSALDQKRAPQ